MFHYIIWHTVYHTNIPGDLITGIRKQAGKLRRNRIEHLGGLARARSICLTEWAVDLFLHKTPTGGVLRPYRFTGIFRGPVWWQTVSCWDIWDIYKLKFCPRCIIRPRDIQQRPCIWLRALGPCTLAKAPFCWIEPFLLYCIFTSCFTLPKQIWKKPITDYPLANPHRPACARQGLRLESCARTRERCAAAQQTVIAVGVRFVLWLKRGSSQAKCCCIAFHPLIQCTCLFIGSIICL